MKKPRAVKLISGWMLSEDGKLCSLFINYREALEHQKFLYETVGRKLTLKPADFEYDFVMNVKS